MIQTVSQKENLFDPYDEGEDDEDRCDECDESGRDCVCDPLDEDEFYDDDLEDIEICDPDPRDLESWY